MESFPYSTLKYTTRFAKDFVRRPIVWILPWLVVLLVIFHGLVAGVFINFLIRLHALGLTFLNFVPFGKISRISPLICSTLPFSQL